MVLGGIQPLHMASNRKAALVFSFLDCHSKYIIIGQTAYLVSNQPQGFDPGGTRAQLAT